MIGSQILTHMFATSEQDPTSGGGVYDWTFQPDRLLASQDAAGWGDAETGTVLCIQIL